MPCRQLPRLQAGLRPGSTSVQVSCKAGAYARAGSGLPLETRNAPGVLLPGAVDRPAVYGISRGKERVPVVEAALPAPGQLPGGP